VTCALVLLIHAVQFSKSEPVQGQSLSGRSLVALVETYRLPNRSVNRFREAVSASATVPYNAEGPSGSEDPLGP
jgi:hypothetical protein